MSRKKKKKNQQKHNQYKNNQHKNNQRESVADHNTCADIVPQEERIKKHVRRHPKNINLIHELLASKEEALATENGIKQEMNAANDAAKYGTGMFGKFRKRLPGIGRALFLPLVILYFEMVLHLSTLGAYTVLSFVVTGLFSVAFGLLLHSLRALVTGKRKRRYLTFLMLVFIAFIFMIFFFIYLEFKIFYDLNTVFFAGGDAAEGFGHEIVRMVTSATGIIHICLFLLPAVSYALGTRVLLQKGFDLYPAYSPKKKIAHFATTALLFICGIVAVHATPSLNAIYTTNYSFTNVVDRMGLLTGLRRDAVRIITGEDKQVAFSFGGTDADLEIENLLSENGNSAGEETSGDNPEDSASAEATGSQNENDEKADEPIVYGDNVLDIDFEKLAEEQPGTMAAIDAYVASLTPTPKNEYTGLFKGKNLIFITMESFSGFPIDKKLFPTLYKLQHEGIYFPNYFIPYVAATTGSEYSLLKGLLPVAGAASMTSTASFHNYMTLGSFFTREGYFGEMFHNGDVWYYDRNITHNQLGYSEPYMAYSGGLDELIEQPFPRRDEDMANVTMPLYTNNEPFNIYYITMSGHSPYEIYNNPFAVPTEEVSAETESSKTESSKTESSETESTDKEGTFSNQMDDGMTDGAAATAQGSDVSEEQDYARNQQAALKEKGYSPLVETYLIYQMEVDKMAKALLEGLEKAGVLEDTVIVMTGDHYPYGVNDGTGYRRLLAELYEYEIVNDFDRDRNNLIIWTPSLAEEEPVQIDDPICSMDVLPTLLNLFGLPYDSRLLPGRDALSETPPLIFNANHDWRTNLGTYIAATGTFTLADGINGNSLPDDYVEKISERVKNKIEYSRSLTYNDYYYHVFGEEYPKETDAEQ